MDTVLAALPPSLLVFVEGQLSSDELSSDEDMLAHFICHGLTGEQARQALTCRDRYLNNLYLDGFTPIQKGARRFVSIRSPGSSSRTEHFPSTSGGSVCLMGNAVPAHSRASP